MSFKLVRTDSEDPFKISLQSGTHKFGRGVFLDCDDKRVSRSHGQLQIGTDSVVLTALHQNPCFYIKKNSELEILKQNSSVSLEHGDKFGVLPKTFWYELIHCPLSTENGEEPIDDAPNISNRDEDNENMEDESALIDFQLNETIGIENRSESPSLIPNEAPEATQIASPQNPEDENGDTETAQTIQQPITESSPSKRSHSDEETTCDVKKVKTEPDSSCDDGNQAAGSSSTSRVKDEPPSPVKPSTSGRERCWYGAQCYRRNPQHKAQFSHPSDPDYNEASMCASGAQCQRTDPRHWTALRHPPGTVPPSSGVNGVNGVPQGHRKKDREKRKRDREVSPVLEVLPTKRDRKRRAVQSWSESESEEDPYGTDESDEWKPQSASQDTEDF